MWVFFYGYKWDKNWIDNDYEKDFFWVVFVFDLNVCLFLFYFRIWFLNGCKSWGRIMWFVKMYLMLGWYFLDFFVVC